MSAGILGPVPLTAGDGLRIEVMLTQWVDPENETAGTEPMDVSAWSWASQWRPAATSSRFIPFTIDDSDAANGKLVLTMTGTQTREMGSSGVYDIEGTQPGDEPWTPLKGTTAWELDVTRA